MTTSTTNNVSIQQEIDAARKACPQIQIPTTVTTDFVQVMYECTPTRRVKATLTFPQGYPTVPLIVDVTTGWGMIVPGLKRKLDKELTRIAQQHVHDQQQVVAVLKHLQSTIDTNLLYPCWRELKQSITVLQQLTESPSKNAKGSGILSTNETKGLIKLKLVHGRYHVTYNITINEGYPTTTSIHDWGKACDIEKSSTNIPPAIERILTQQCQALVRHLQDGMPSDEAVRTVVPSIQSQSPSKVKQPTKATSNKKKDQASHSSNEEIKAKEAWQQEEAKRISSYEIPSYDGSHPQPSLLPLVEFMIATIQEFPGQHCPVCEKSIVPTDPTALAALYTSSSSKSALSTTQQQKRPVQPTCGCWYHTECLNNFLTQPPFGDDGCPTCGSTGISHPSWTQSRSEREQTYAQQQTRQREIDDVAMMF
jgi:hypothetical protein